MDNLKGGIMKNKYRIKQEILKNGESRYTIQKKFLFWWDTYFLENGYGSFMLQYDHLQEALVILESFEEANKVSVAKVRYLYKEDEGE